MALDEQQWNTLLEICGLARNELSPTLLELVREFLIKVSGCTKPETRMIFGCTKTLDSKNQFIVDKQFYYGKFEYYGNQIMLFVPANSCENYLVLIDEVTFPQEPKEVIKISGISLREPVLGRVFQLSLRRTDLDYAFAISVSTKLNLRPECFEHTPDVPYECHLAANDRLTLYSWFYRNYCSHV